MAQHDYIIDNQPGASFRADLNSALAAIVSNNSGATAPATTYPFQWWADTTADILKQRDASNSTWIDVLDLNTGRPVQGVGATSNDGAALLPQGNNAARPADGGPAGFLAVRGNTESLSDYFAEYWDRVAETWRAFAARDWVQAITNALATRISALEAVRTNVIATNTNQVSYDITGIPAWATEVTVALLGCANNGPSSHLVRLGTTGGVQATGYTGIATRSTSTGTVQQDSNSTGFPVYGSSVSAADTTNATVILTKGPGNQWAAAQAGHVTAWSLGGGGFVTLSGALDRIRLVPSNGVAPYTAGALRVSWR